MAAAGVSDRARAMARRLDETASRLGVDDAGRARIAAAHEVAMAPRLAAGVDDHHADFFHPARNALILMDDAGVREPLTLAAALVLETRDAALVAEPAALRSLGDDLVALLAAVPDGNEPDRLLEDLVAAPAAARLAAVAERLDHARHLHMRPETEWEAYHDTTCRCYAPAAARAHPRLEQRLTWWCETFQRRFLDGR